jgi:hypothetical protein
MSSDREVAVDTVVVVVDEEGVILATAHRETYTSPDAPPILEIRPRPGQRVHTVELPPELARLGLRERVDRLHESYRLSSSGELAPLADDSAG